MGNVAGLIFSSIMLGIIIGLAMAVGAFYLLFTKFKYFVLEEHTFETRKQDTTALRD